MHIVVVGFNHQSTPVEVREQASFSVSTIGSVQDQLRRQSGVHEVTVLSTCNRTEVYTVSICPLAGETAARALLAKAAGYLYVHRDRAAIEHLFRVASGIDSMVLGETEILGQVRRAAELAQEGNAAGRALSALFQHAVHAGKRARTETRISHHTLSTSTAAVALARAQAGGLRGKTVLLIGTGAMASQAADALSHDGIRRLMVVSRTASRAAERAAAWGKSFAEIEPLSLDSLSSRLDQADVVIAATTAAQPVVTREAVGGAVNGRSTPVVIVDLGVPRNIDSSVRHLSAVHYFDIDDLHKIVEANLAERRREVSPVERIVAAEAESFETWLRALWVQPIITTLRSRAEEIRSSELERAFRRLHDLSPREREIVSALSQAIVSKLLHQPTIRLKEHAGEGRGYQFAEALRDLFNLEQGR